MLNEASLGFAYITYSEQASVYIKQNLHCMAAHIYSILIGDGVETPPIWSQLRYECETKEAEEKKRKKKVEKKQVSYT